MKTIIALIQPTKLEAVREALKKIEVARLTVSDALGYAETPGECGTYRGCDVKLAGKTMLRIVVNEDFLERTIDLITEVARTGTEGHDGDGKIFVLPTVETIWIKNGQRGPGAV